MNKKPFVTKEQIEEIAKTYPTPFHLYDEKGIRENVKREKEAFDDVYNQFVAGLNSSINKDMWDELTLDTTDGIQTDSFFEIFEKHCGEI